MLMRNSTGARITVGETPRGPGSLTLQHLDTTKLRLRLRQRQSPVPGVLKTVVTTLGNQNLHPNVMEGDDI